MVDEQILRAFESVGIPKMQTLVYLDLLKNKESSATQVSKRTKMHRANVYDTLTKLKEKNLVYLSTKDGKQVFAALPSDLIVSEEKEKLDNLKLAINHIKSTYVSGQTPRVYTLEGVNATGAQVGTKTVYIYNVSTNYNGICVQNVENASIPSANCNSTGEFRILSNGITDGHGVTCTKSANDTTLVISGLQNSGIIQQNVPVSIAPVNLGTAGNFAILAKTGVSSTGTTSVVGNIGVSPIDSTAITGFGLILDSSTQFATSSLVNGSVYAADYVSPTPDVMTTAIGDMQTAYTDASGRTLPDHTELGAGDISGMTLYPGLYKWGTGVTINTGVTLDCQGNSSAVFIFQVAQTLTVGNGAIITLGGSCQASNIFWQVAGQTTLGTTSDFKGNILDQTAVVINNGAVLNGRALAQTAVTLDANAVTSPSTATPVLTTISLSQSANISIGSTRQLNTTSLDQFGLPMTANISYVSSNSSIISVNASGFISAIAFGNATITASNGTINGYSNMVVVEAPVTQTDSGSSSGGGGGGSYCSTQWTCSSWSTCANEVQTRVCTYPSNFCAPSAYNKPNSTQACSTTDNTNTIDTFTTSSNNTTTPIKTNSGITGAVIGGGNAGKIGVIAIIVLAILSGIVLWVRAFSTKKGHGIK